MSRPAAPSLSLGELAQVAKAQLRGDGRFLVKGVAPLEEAGPQDLSFYQPPRSPQILRETRAGALILREQEAGLYGGHALISSNPYASFARVLQHLYPATRPVPGVEAGAWVASDARVHPGACIEAGVRVAAGAIVEDGCWLETGVVLGAGVRLGAGCHLFPGVKVYAGCEIGPDCTIHANAVIGADGFGFAPDGDAYVKIPHVGGVRIGRGVEIGANSCIDRGVMADTVIGDGVKIDNLVQIGHNVTVGEHTVIAGQTGVSGSTTIGAHCRIGGQVGFAGHIRIADGCIIAGQSAITHDLRTPGVYSGVLPARPARRWRRLVARFDALEEFAQRFKQWEKTAVARASAHREESDD
ncbi:MAG: UDP-3-O-(3-hydroxymyristoyl)glucosamine N-acyltransferase [Acidithiobacillus sp.]|uniref:UDP-3-O-(3-hydroxymyristoyl)glucosamine N-acyltransferase n=1 Tax=Acidithiobacillus sp. TaxID=1872118 RepID=UPI003D029DBD